MNAEKLEPLHDLVLVERRTPDTKSPAGLILPEHSKSDRQAEGVVHSAGPGKYAGGVFIATTVQPGDRVVFGKQAGNEVNLNGQPLLLIPFDHIMAVLR